MRRLLVFLAIVLIAVPAFADRTFIPSITLATSSGTVASGSRGLVFVLSSDFTGTILGVAWSGATDQVVQIPIPSGEMIAAVAYTVTAGSLKIIQVK